MAEKHVMAEQDYLQGLKYKEIADKYEVSLNTVKSWKKRYGWIREKGAPSEKSVHTKRPGAPPGNRNAVGNRGGAAPPRNSNAVTHGFFRKFLPDDTAEIMEAIETCTPLDMLWDQIKLAYAAILRAQQTMDVTGKDEMIKELKKQKFEVHNVGTKKEPKLEQVLIEEEHAFQFSWDRQATFLNAQSRAMGTLMNLIRQYEEMCRLEDVDELHAQRLLKLKGEVALLTKKIDSDDDKPIEILIKRKGAADD